MSNAKEVLKKALDNGLVTISEWNRGIYSYIIYRVVWETKSNYVLYAVDSEQEAERIVNGFNSDEYFYEKVRIN
jgi:hypothetical protein